MALHVLQKGEVIPQEVRSLISKRYRTVTAAINRDFWKIEDDRANSIYVGSYGRGTAINTSDLDILISLPIRYYTEFNLMTGNVQSRLLQSIRGSILNSYPNSDVSADGQVVKINFSDGMNFEILPAFKKLDNSFIYPDSNMGGHWKSTNPKAEQFAMEDKNKTSNGLLYDTCKHFRFIRDNYFKSYHLSGIVIDSFIYWSIGDWHWLAPNEFSTCSPGAYESFLSNNLISLINRNTRVLPAPGSKMPVDINSDLDCLLKVMNKITG